MNEPLICGLDEAGRGPVFGPLILCGICFKESDLHYLKEIGVKDSKRLSPDRRVKLARILKERCCLFRIKELTPREIDQRIKKRISLNQLELLKFVEIANELNPNKIYIDAADTDETRFGNTLRAKLDYTPETIISKHKADDIYPIVGAASIIAKVKRDEKIKKLKQKYGDVGSGYPSDKTTITFLRKWIQIEKQPPPFARVSWKTTKEILDKEVNNKKITQFF
jgi:ribonuclease HII